VDEVRYVGTEVLSTEIDEPVILAPVPAV